jgi:hypothetical protein
MPRILKKGLRWAAKRRNINDIPPKPGVYALYYYGKRRYIGKSKNLRRRIKRHFRESDTPFTEFTWFQTVPSARHSLESDLINRDFDELWNVISGRRRS